MNLLFLDSYAILFFKFILANTQLILKTFLSDGTMVRLSLDRINALPSVPVDELFKTKISHILYNDVRNSYGASTFEGKLCRKILRNFQNLCSK
jgi:hypothetical protein